MVLPILTGFGMPENPAIALFRHPQFVSSLQMSFRVSKYQIATGVALLFHAIGLLGLTFWDKELFLRFTPFNLLLMLLLLLWTQPKKTAAFWFFLAGCFLVGMAAEVVGVRTGWLFGHYSYGRTMSWQIFQVPWLLGVNWFLVVFCAGMTMHGLLRISYKGGKIPGLVRILAVLLGGALLAVFYDWLLEPVAIALDYWHWISARVPIYNYLSWFMVSAALLALFEGAKMEKRNKFAVNLMLIQWAFFLLLRAFLK